ncbi:SDR family NAD(P)-dependent oxidoreductase [Rhodococcus sp. NPDC058514]|uniref:SDR family NAD(P)-dependent oxidoreductase n=1 Tax=unclassified Rhodococcus (in: high G+C Gram-positive bacteria) TaxID=192944 RepID=UPI0036595E17
MTVVDLSLEGKTALITGSSRGIGLSIAELFAEHGAEVVLVSRKQDELDQVAEKINAAGGRAHAIAAHMGKQEDVRALVRELAARELEVDILVNNAGISPPNGKPLVDTTEALWDKVMDVNLKGPFFLSAALGKAMAERGRGGSIVNISTTSALQAQPEIGTYCISKAALNTMTRNFARELGPAGVRVNAISCGVIATLMGDHTLNDPERREMFLKISPIKRAGLPEEIARTALMLASDVTSYTTGVILQADGGVLA